jgi:hypothetical protein
MLNEVGGMAVARHVRSPLVLTNTQMLEVAGQLSAAGIVGDDMTTSLRTLLANASYVRYSTWRLSLVGMSSAVMAETYGHDAARAALVLSHGRWT